MRSFFSFLFCMLTALSVFAAPAQRPLRILYLSNDPSAVHHLTSTIDPDSAAVFANIFDSLVHPSLDGEIQPGLAVSWKRTAPTKWEFVLRKGVKFHDGSDFTGDDVKFNFDYILDPKNKAGYNGLWSNVKSVEVDPNDKFKVVFETNHPDASLLHMMLEFGSIAPKAAFEKAGLEGFGKMPIGTGPYKFKEWVRGKHIVLVKNPDYWDKGIPKIDTLEYLIVPEEEWFNMMKDGKADLAPNLSGRFANRLVKEGGGKTKIIKRRVLMSYWFFLKNTGPMADKRVRLALNEAINRPEIIKFADYGNGAPLYSLGKKGEFGASTKDLQYPYDVENAKALLKQAGFPKGFKMKVLVSDVAASVAKVLKANLQKIGVELELEVVPRTTWTEKMVVYKIMNNGKLPDYDGSINLVDNPTYNLSFHAFMFLHSHGPFSLLNSPEYDEKLGYAISAPDEAEHKKRLQALDEYIHDEALMIFTTQRILTVAVNRDLSIQTFNLSGHLGRHVLSSASWLK